MKTTIFNELTLFRVNPSYIPLLQVMFTFSYKYEVIRKFESSAQRQFQSMIRNVVLNSKFAKKIENNGCLS